MSIPSRVAAVIGIVILLALVAVGGYKLEWWLREDAVNRTTGIANDSLARQQAALDDALDKAATISNIDVQLTTVTEDQARVLEAQRVAIVDQFCTAYGSLTGQLTAPPSLVSLSIQECN